MPIDLKNIEASKELKALGKTFDKLKNDAMKLITESKDELQGRKRAEAINKKLQETGVLPRRLVEGRRKCPEGTTYDPETNTCV